MPCFSTFFSDNSFRPAFQMFGYSDRMVPINTTMIARHA